MEGDRRSDAKYSWTLEISIHALRVEGDVSQAQYDALQRISIHALRVEGDIVPDTVLYNAMIFLSTPSGWRATSTGLSRH